MPSTAKELLMEVAAMPVDHRTSAIVKDHPMAVVRSEERPWVAMPEDHLVAAMVREHQEVVMARVPTTLVWRVDNPAVATAWELLMATVATAMFSPTVATVGGHFREDITRGHPTEATNNSREYILTALLHMVVALMVATVKGTLTLLLRGKHMDAKPADTEADSTATDR